MTHAVTQRDDEAAGFVRRDERDEIGRGPRAIGAGARIEAMQAAAMDIDPVQAMLHG